MSANTGLWLLLPCLGVSRGFDVGGEFDEVAEQVDARVAMIRGFKVVELPTWESFGVLAYMHGWSCFCVGNATVLKVPRNWGTGKVSECFGFI